MFQRGGAYGEEKPSEGETIARKSAGDNGKKREALGYPFMVFKSVPAGDLH